MNIRGKTVLIAIALLAIAFAAPTRAAQTISVDFQGRKSDNTGAGTAMLPTEVAGVVPVANWNAVNDSVTTPKAENGTTAALVDSTGASTPVTLTFAANDSWNNDVDPTTITTGNARMMNGVIKEQGAGTSASFIFNNVPEGQYDVYVYMDSNNDNVALNVSDSNFLQTYYVVAQHQFANNAAFLQATNTKPSTTLTNRDTGNYVKLSNVATFGSGSIGVSAKYIQGGDGLGIAGIEIVNTGASPVNTNQVVLTSQPQSQKYAVGAKLSFSVTKTGPGTFQWFKNGTAIAGATNATFLTPGLTAADDQAAYHVVVKNNVNSVTSSDAIATLSQLTAVGFAKEERYDGLVKSDVEDPALAAAPNIVRYLPYFEVPVNQADNFAERISAIFTPAVSGSYVFFVCSDDDSDLFLSTDDTPANKKLIAQETTWSNSRQWVTSAGNSDLTAKRSDQFASSEWPGGTITLTAGKRYYIEGVHHEGGGGDDFAATFILAGQPDPVDGSAPTLTGSLIQTIAQDQGIKITINTQPASVSAQEQTTTTLKVAATGIHEFNRIFL